MMWQYWIELYTRTFCGARGLSPKSIAAYAATLKQFREYARIVLDDKPPDRITTQDALRYLQHLRDDRMNGASAVNRTATVLRSFYRAMVAMGHLETRDNPMQGLPSIKATPQKQPGFLKIEEVERLLIAPPDDTIIGLRDRAMLVLFYGTGIRASECSHLREGDVDFDHGTVTVVGKGGHERTVPMNDAVVDAMLLYRHHRGPALPRAPFFRSRLGNGMSRGAIYQRVRYWGHRAKIRQRISPHRLRHTFATHLVHKGVNVVTIRDLLGHKQVTSTQIYFHSTAHDLREAANKHPISNLMETIEHLLPDVRLPFQYAPRGTGYG
ncbi:MAG: tyrosine-type recombinase/integrase [Woeseiaceae bacterium]